MEDKIYLTKIQYDKLRKMLEKKLKELKTGSFDKIEKIAFSNLIFQIEMLILCLTDFARYNEKTFEYELKLSTQNKERLLGYLIYEEMN